MKKVFEVGADMGSVKLGNEDVFFFFHNGYGDGGHKCIIYEKGHKKNVLGDTGHFEGQFCVREKNKVHLYEYDCGGSRIYTFALGRYFVYSDKKGYGTVTIYYLDDEIENVNS